MEESVSVPHDLLGGETNFRGRGLGTTLKRKTSERGIRGGKSATPPIISDSESHSFGRGVIYLYVVKRGANRKTKNLKRNQCPP